MYVNGCAVQWITHLNIAHSNQRPMQTTLLNTAHGDRAPTQHKWTTQHSIAHGDQAPVRTQQTTQLNVTIRKHTMHDGSELLHPVGFFKELKFRGWCNCCRYTLCTLMHFSFCKSVQAICFAQNLNNEKWSTLENVLKKMIILNAERVLGQGSKNNHPPCISEVISYFSDFGCGACTLL